MTKGQDMYSSWSLGIIKGSKDPVKHNSAVFEDHTMARLGRMKVRGQPTEWRVQRRSRHPTAQWVQRHPTAQQK
jgi:hypothetical protein